MQHELKLTQPYFNAVHNGKKSFELRKNDRDFKTSDTLLLREWVNGEYTGKVIVRTITYILKDYIGIEDGYCILGLDWSVQNDK